MSTLQKILSTDPKEAGAWGILGALILALLLQVFLVGFAFLKLVVFPLLNSGDFQGDLRDWLELFYFASGVILAVTAVVALLFAGLQIRSLKETQHHDVHQRNATVFLEIEARFSSREMMATRKKVDDLTKKVNPTAVGNKRFRRQFANELTSLRANSRDDYVKTMEVVFFLEALGLLADRHYMEFKDIYLLLAPAINDYDDIFRLHLLERRRGTGQSPLHRKKIDLYGQTLRLMRLIRHRSN